MAVHTSYASMLRESLQEMLEIAFIGKDKKKENGGIYGYPVTLILFCIADAISTWSGHGEHTLGALNDKRFYNLQIDTKTLKQVRVRYRDLLAHNLVIAPTDLLTH